MKLENVKGTRDILPSKKIQRMEIVNKLKNIFEKYGYNPLETPALEMLDILTSKFAGGEEILKEMYTLTDQGKREIGLRYDLTVPFARVVASNQLKLPFKRYQIDKVWRDGPIKLGRYREFWQCDCDVVGIKSVLAEAELLTMASEFFKEIGMNIILTVNNMKLLKDIMKNVPEEKKGKAILIVDKLKKIGKEGVLKELKTENIEGGEILEILSIKGSNEEILKKLEGRDGVDELKELISYLKEFGTEVKLDISLARGLAYYTGTIYEGFLIDNKITSSICSGGRYDNMIGNFSGKETPAVGISFGLDVISEALGEGKKSITKIYIIPINTTIESIKILKELRKTINCDMDFNNKSISKNLDFVNKQGIPYALIIGEDELKDNKFTLKDMIKGEEKKISLDEIKKIISQ